MEKEEKKVFKTLSIGDIHGRDSWKILLFGSRENYEKWRDVCDENIDSIDSNEFPLFKYNKVIFIGDYVDSFDIPPVLIKKNLEELIHLKLKFPGLIILLLGNHDISYIKDLYCGGFQPAMLHDYKDLFSTKLEGESIFSVAYQYKDWLWTHAGITMGFYNDVIVPLKNNKKSRFADIYKNCKDLAEVINFMYDSVEEKIFNVGFSRGGYKKVPGPFWADKRDLNGKPALSINQIVGHTPQSLIKGYEFNEGRYKDHPISLYFIDNLGGGMDQVLDIEFSEEIPKINIVSIKI